MVARFLIAKATVVALIGICGSGAVVGCSAGRDRVAQRSVGQVSLKLTIAPGVDVNEVSFTVVGNGISPITNKIPVANLGSTASAFVGGLPAGAGYNITLSAVSVDGKTHCGGSAPFSVVAGQTTSVSIALQCRGPETTGGVQVGGTFNNCPTVDSLVVFPLQVLAGGSISVFSGASDLDGNMLTTKWSATAGNFVDEAAKDTSYICYAAGNQTLTVTVSDGNPACNATAQVGVECLAAGICGNFVVDLGEQCDDANLVSGDGCSSICLREIFCSDGLKEGNEECDDSNKVSGDGCSSTCQTEICGNNRVDANEQCDPPNGVTCDAQCMGIGLACGNGIKQAYEACDDGNLISGDGCELDCTITPDPCKTCLAASCQTNIDACTNATGTAAAGPAAGQPKSALCAAMNTCADTTKCARGSFGSGEACYCGTVDTTNCISGLANGLCKTEAERAAETTSGLTVGQRWVNPGFAVGISGQYIRCSLQQCKTQCGLGSGSSSNCGNGVKEGNEACDDGNTSSGDGCSAACLTESCGNSRLDVGEDCDPPDGTSCDVACKFECGNGIRHTSEECDDGNRVSNDGCDSSCRREVCGNRLVEGNEECDPPNGTSCDTVCKRECGNGVQRGGEECDDGNRVGGDGCEADCRISSTAPCPSCVALRCQSSIDACSTATGNAAAGPAAGQPKKDLCGAMIDCANTTKCAKGSLGSGERCYCGTFDTTSCISGFANGPCRTEAERAAESTTGLTVGQRWANSDFAIGLATSYIRCTLEKCKSQCELGAAICGDGVADGAEGCDDGNKISGDGCSSTCSPEIQCGDGNQEGHEGCDDGNTVSGDGCSSSCLTEACGNFRLDADEECDPPNGTTCDAACKNECGNGIVRGLEECDDGNRISGDGCEYCILPSEPTALCLGCIGASCQSFIDRCTTATGTAAAGPAAGQPKKDLCGAMIDCANATKCAKGSLGSGEGCYCGTVDTTSCISGLANGLCKTEAERAAETTSGLTVGQRWVDPRFAVGISGQYIRCSLQQCKTQCGLQ
ncbi:MAG: DUF4215 domain-containing protein [Polyangiaceae bacterium]|nr:DUF4215 domain-containing protein [Polyangiaceae bacterium]